MMHDHLPSRALYSPRLVVQSKFFETVANIWRVHHSELDLNALLSSPALRFLAEDPDRFGLRPVPSLALEAVKKPGKEYGVDIVAVHGIGGDLYRTWTQSIDQKDKDQVFWLAHLLPVDLPGARVFSFGYSSEPIFSRTVASVRDYAKQLLQSLLDPQDSVWLDHWGRISTN